MRAYEDKTSTCGSCSYWSEGFCQWHSVPAWVGKLIGEPFPKDYNVMGAGDGINCWQHTKREGEPPPSSGAKLLRALSLVKGGSPETVARNSDG